MAESRSPFDRKHEITLTIDEFMLTRVSDETLALWWHVAQANPADGFANREPGEIAMKVGWEIIRRWLKNAPVEMYHHQQEHYFWKIASSMGSWPGPERVFVPHEPVTADLSVVLEALDTSIDRAHLIDHAKEFAYKKARTAIQDGMRAQAARADVPETEAGDG